MILAWLLVALALWTAESRAVEPWQWTPPSTNEMRDLATFLDPHRTELNLPALAAVIVRSNEVVAAGVAGVRKSGSSPSVTLQDRFHFGSCTKSMTALLAVELQREGKINLTNTVGELFPDWDLDAAARSITLENLLQNRSGLAHSPPPAAWDRAWQASGTPSEQRIAFLRDVLREPIEAPPGTKYIYSNTGFALAGAMLEKRLGIPWEKLVADRIFGPLGLKTAGFGAPTTAGPEQPWGHQYRDGSLLLIDPSDNPPAIAPGAAVHLSVLEAARYAAFHLAIFNGDVAVLKPYRTALYTPPDGSDYALGWMVQKRSWADGAVLFHTGSNTMFFTVIWIAPHRRFACVVMTNVGDKAGEVTAGKCDKVVEALIREFLR